MLICTSVLEHNHSLPSIRYNSVLGLLRIYKDQTDYCRTYNLSPALGYIVFILLLEVCVKTTTRSYLQVLFAYRLLATY